jgi:serine/threonine-protein kinase
LENSESFLRISMAAPWPVAPAAPESWNLVIIGRHLMPLSEGSKIGPYEVVAPLGAGGMGEVWRARDPRLGRDVALKVLPDEMFRDAGRVARFHAEARAASALNHPNIVAVYDIGEDDGRTYLAMELLEGATLRQLLDGGTPLLPKALQISCQIADGLAAAHARGIVHRDLKPENVMLTTDGVVKILDFGLAKTSPLAASHGEDEPTMSATPVTSAGTLLGTIGYMSPEQASGNVVDFRSDQFSFGTILYELVTGRRAWKKATPAETLVAILREDPPPLSSAESSVPAPVRRIVERCLAKDSHDRYGSTRDLAGDVRYLVDHFSEIQATSDIRPAVEPSPRVRRRFAPAVLGVLALVAIVALGAVIWNRLRPGHAAITSLAVLPFENGTRDPDSEYLSDGITESLIDQMSRLPALKVMARATVFHFKGSGDPQEAGRKLGVGAVLMGRISRREGRLSISAELVDVRTGARLWGDKYDRPFADLLRVQDQIASDISAGLRLRLTEPEKRVLNRHGTENTEAYELFLKARYALSKDTEEAYLEAARLLKETVAKDPDFAEAYALAAGIYANMAVDGYMRPAEAFARQDEGARKALALHPGLPQARHEHASRRFFFDWDWDGAERELRELLAESADPGAFDSRVFALLLWSRGRTAEALAEMEKSRRLDPGNLVLTITTADYLKKAGNLKEAGDLYRAAMEAEPSDPRALFGLAEVLRRQGDVKDAIVALSKAYELSGEDDGVKALAAAHTEKDYENAQVAVARVRLGDLEALAKERYVSPLELARLEAQAGEREKAFAHLEAAFVERSSGLVLLKVDTAWDRIRDDTRFAALVKKVGIP